MVRVLSQKNIFGRCLAFLSAALLALVIFTADAPGLRSSLPVSGGQDAGNYLEDAIAPDPIDDRLPYITINVAAGLICLRKADTVLLGARCSAGSGAELRDPATGRVWSFTTPTGVFHVQAKAKNPIWKKPDWAYLEKDLPIPENPTDRLTTDELGGYSLNLGGGLYLHGTIYTRLLGMNVTHGCIRVGDDDLAKIYDAVEIGTPVYIFNAGGHFEDSNTEQVLEIDYGSCRTRLLMDGQIVWEATFAANGIDNSSKSMSNAVAARHLYTGKVEYEDHELAVVADELRITSEKLQRIYPGLFAIVLDDGSVLEVATNINAAIFSRWDNACFDVLRLISAPFGEHGQQLSMSTTDALTFFTLTQPGLVIRPGINVR
ncbi:L,D-transpeptidase [Candidatus Zixiibacteriota bacterium]